MRTVPILALGLSLLLCRCGGSEPEAPEAPEPAATRGAPANSPAPDATPPPLGDVQVSIVPLAPAGIAGADLVREYTRMFYAGELEALVQKFSPEMREDILPLDKLRALREELLEQYGEEVQVLGEDAKTRDEYRAFARFARFSKNNDVLQLQWILRPDDSVAGFKVMPAKKPQPR